MVRKSTRKIKWVNNYKDIINDVPTTAHLDEGTNAYYYEPTNTIYLIRGKSKKYDLHHEIFHSIHHHSEHPRSPAEFVNREVGANVYSYKKVKQPTHILSKLRGFYNELVAGEYEIRNKEALALIKQALIKNGAPESWMKDYAELKRLADKING